MDNFNLGLCILGLRGAQTGQLVATSIPSTTIYFGNMEFSNKRIMSAGGACQKRSCTPAKRRLRSALSFVFNNFLGRSFMSKDGHCETRFRLQIVMSSTSSAFAMGATFS